MARRTYRVNKDKWTHLLDILVATPDDFNSDDAVLRGRTMGEGFPIPNNRLSGETRKEFYAAWNAGRIEYIIWSYDTPIAWRERTTSPNRVKGSNGHTVGFSQHRWVMPDVTYSMTTSKHQGKVRVALSEISGGI